MSRRHIALQYALSAQRKELEARKAEEASQVAKYFDTHSKVIQHYKSWTTEEYYEKAKKEAEKLAKSKEKEKKLEERRNKLEKLLYKENLEYEEEMRVASRRPKLFKKGFINSPSQEEEINQGFLNKELALRKNEECLREYYRNIASPILLKAAEERLLSGKPKEAWIDNVAETVVKERKDEEAKRKEIEIENEKLMKEMAIQQSKVHEKNECIKGIKTKLNAEVSRYTQLETEQKATNEKINNCKHLLGDLNKIFLERSDFYKNRPNVLGRIKMAMYKYALKMNVSERIEGLEFDTKILHKISQCLEQTQLPKDCTEELRRIIYKTRREISSRLESERERCICIDSMFDGEARQLYSGQIKLWSTEQSTRDSIIEATFKEVLSKVEGHLERLEFERKINIDARQEVVAALDQAVSTHNEEASDKSNQLNLTNLEKSLKGVKRREDDLNRRARARQEQLKEKETELLRKKEIVDRNRNGGLVL